MAVGHGSACPWLSAISCTTGRPGLVRPRWWVPILITVLLIWAQVADTLVTVEAALPIAAVCALRMYRRGGPWRGQVYDGSLVVGALLSAGFAKVVLTTLPTETKPVPSAREAANNQ